MIMSSSALKHDVKASPYWSSQVRIHQTGFRFYYILDVKRSTGKNHGVDVRKKYKLPRLFSITYRLKTKEKNQSWPSLIIF